LGFNLDSQFLGWDSPANMGIILGASIESNRIRTFGKRMGILHVLIYFVAAFVIPIDALLTFLYDMPSIV